MSTKHTPGFWKIDYGHQTKRPRGISSAARNIVNFGGLASPASAETVANANLIAAAPDLLAALQAALPFIDDAGDIAQFYPDSSATDKCRAAVKQAHEALAKATGGTQ